MSKSIENNNYNWYNEKNEYNHSIMPNPLSYNENYLNTYCSNINNSRLFRNLTNDVVRIEFPYDIKGILNDVVNIHFRYHFINDVIKIEFNQESNDIGLEILDTTLDYKEYIPEVIELTQNDLVNRLNYKTNRLFDVINTYDNDMNDMNDSTKREILKEVFKLTHSINTRYSEKKLNKWIENFPNMIDDKIKAIKNKKKDVVRSKKAKLSYKTSELRYLNIIRKINTIGYYGFDESQIRHKMTLLEDDEIIQDLINEFSEENQDHDMLEVNNEEERIYNENMDIFKHYNGDD